MKSIFITLILFLLPLLVIGGVNENGNNIIGNHSFSQKIIMDADSLLHLGVNGNVVLNSDTSMVQMILEDTEGVRYLIYEASPMLLNGYSDTFYDESEETSFLNSIHASSIRFIIRDAQICIDSLLVLQGPNTSNRIRAISDSTSFHKYEEKVRKINQYNESHGLLWRANVTPQSWRNYQERISIFGDSISSSFQGIEYYTDGIFQVGIFNAPRQTPPSDSELYASYFSWEDWCPEVRSQMLDDQDDSNYCWAFTGCGVAETLLNMCYNQHLDLHLSEEDVAQHSGGRVHHSDIQKNGGGYIESAARYIERTGVCMEDEFPLDRSPRKDENGETTLPYSERSNPIFHIKSSGQEKLFHNETVREEQIDSVKRALVMHGPLLSFFSAVGDRRHAMPLVGYGTVQEGDISFVQCSSQYYQTIPIINATHEHKGDTYWIFRNSYGPTGAHNGYLYFIFYEYSSFHMPMIMFPPFTVENEELRPDIASRMNVLCEDKDGDGYYTWGFKQPKPDFLPEWIPEEQDGDDNDYTKRQYNQYGKLMDIEYNPNDTIYIDDNYVFNDLKHLYRPVKIRNNATLTIASTIVGHGDASITMEEGAVLDISDGKLDQVSIIGKESSIIKIHQDSQLNLSHSHNKFINLQRQL